jgi:hypothetical protein
MKHYPVLTIAACCFLAVSSLARADGLFYLSGKVATTSADADIGESVDLILDGDDEGFALGLGLRLGDYLAFELAYHDFGTIPADFGECVDCPGLTAPFEGDTTAISLTFLPHLPVSENFLLYGKVGVVSWETSLSDLGPGIEDALDDYSDEDLTYGAGIRFLLPGPFGIFAEFERFADSFDSVSLGATLGF